MGLQFTKAQQDAMNARGRTLLVSAAAGSGKTFTLTRRIIKSITEEGRDISRMLIVTFTRAAAGELRAKISKALSEAIAEDPGNAHLQAQILKLASAKISTIDSFFTEPIRANFEKLGLPASLRLSDEAELSPMRETVMAEVLEQVFEGCEGLSNGTLSSVGYRDLLTDLAGIITVARDSSKLIPTLLTIYNKLNTATEGISLLLSHADRMERAAKEDFFKSSEGARLRKEHTVILRNVKASFARLADMTASVPDMEAPHATFVSDLDTVSLLLYPLEDREVGYREVRSAFEKCKFVTYKGPKKELVTPACESNKKRRDELKKQVSELQKKLYLYDESYISHAFSESALILRTIYAILAEFERKYNTEKAKKGLCEFSDMPKFMLRLLLDEQGRPTDYADTLYESFDEVYIDEYQDVNEIQDRIFALIGRDHRFMVGDIKQSIYGFREAEPSIFADYRSHFTVYDREDAALPTADGGNTIFMSNNFRCDQNVVDFTNLICSRIFSAFSESIGYTADDDLVFSKRIERDDYISPKVILSIIETPPADENDIEEADAPEEGEDGGREPGDALSSGNLADEAMVTANEIARLIRDERGYEGQPLRGGDMAVLVRSHSHAKPLTEALERLNIKYVLSSKTGLFEDRDMKLLIDLLSVIDNPRNDIPLCRLLSADCETISPLFSFEELLKMRLLRKQTKAGALYDALLRYADEGEDRELAARCSSFHELITKLRLLSSRLPADKFLRALSSLERYHTLCTTDAFTYLYDCACRYVRRNWNGLYSFLKYLKQLQEKGESGKEPEKGDPDSVVIMTIHQSKGLEFNTCFLFGMGKQFNMSDTKEPLICTKEYGLSMKLHPLEDPDADPIDSTAARYENTPLWLAGVETLRQKQIEEEARILYVGLTRARERLYVSGTLSRPYAEVLDKTLQVPDPVYAMRNSRTYLSWILLALSKAGGEGEIYERRILQKGQVSLTTPFRRLGAAEAGKNASSEELAYATLMQQEYGLSKEEQLLSTIPAKVAASKVSSTMLDEGIFIPIPSGKLFAKNEEDPNEGESENALQLRRRIELMRGQRTDFDSLLEVNKKPTAAEKGTAAHRFLQFCDYQNVDENGLDAELERLTAERFISERTARIIDRRSLSGFFQSALYAEIRKAAVVRREFRFGMFRSAADFTENSDLKDLLTDKKIFVQGSVDLILETAEGELLLCDYKTDRVTPEEKADPSLLAARMKETHGDQLEQYKFAIRQIFGKPPSRIYIYSVPAGIAVEI